MAEDCLVLSGTVRHGRAVGTAIGLPTANLHGAQDALQAGGVWCCMACLAGGGWRPALTHIGPRPTLDTDPAPSVETWIPGFSGDLNGRDLTLALWHRLRDVHRFSSADALVNQVQKDWAQCEALMQRERVTVSISPEETHRIACQMSATLQPGDTVLLMGPMGAGKSAFARGVAAGLGIKGPVPSPSFTIMNLYEDGLLPLCHFDWYRIADSSELYDIGLNEYIGFPGVCLIEWAQRAWGLVPDTRLEVHLSPLGEQERLIRILPRGSWEAQHT